VTEMTWGGDPYHEGAARPMDSMQGGMEQPHTQQPMTSEAQTNPRSASTDNVGQSWDSSSLGPKPGLNPANKNPVH
jgi:hypothetical protein